ncbi:NAD(P)-dependent oxidoreductase [Candidiatus Paracoxiella cheracis]|uniref:NAD(P)-dependent oxidoreductase n=1 Tax=Candidiatus Paracoxiella cheracis TaxID=3405120 RepID=UPI003BF5C80C
MKKLFGSFGDIIQKPGSSIHHDDLIDADVLLTRTVTRADAELLHNTAVKFVGSATAGYDHLDIEWLRRSGIFYCYAPGVNAIAVAEYVIGCVAYLNSQQILPENCRAGIVGVGHIGAEVQQKLTRLGLDVLCNDPPRAQHEPTFHSAPLSHFYDVDLICIHTPLTMKGEFPTYHLIDESFLEKLKPGCVLLNAGRGAVVNNQALAAAEHIVACLDVWENEPDIHLDMLKKAEIATPHIAGYSLQAKYKATYAVYQKFIEHFNLNDPHQDKSPENFIHDINLPLQQYDSWQQVVLAAFNPHHETVKMKTELLNHSNDVGQRYEKLRRDYPLRNEFSTHTLTQELSPSTQSILKKLGIK